MSSTLEVGKRLVELCQQGKLEECVSELYGEDIVSIEPGAPPGADPVARGLAAVHAKGEWWNNNHDVHSFAVAGPYPSGDRFIVFFEFDITQKATGHRFTMKEGALYTVKDGKIVQEEFFYTMG